MSCSHTAEFDAPRWTEPTPDAQDACPDCAAIGSTVWAHLRSFEPGENWRWCYEDQRIV